MMGKLPSDFDLLYDIKTEQDLKACWQQEGSGRRDATRMQLVWLCRHHEIGLIKIVGPYTMSDIER